MSTPVKDQMISEEDQNKKMEEEKPVETVETNTEKKAENAVEPVVEAPQEEAVVANPNAMQTEEIQEEKKEEKKEEKPAPPAPVVPAKQLTKTYNYGSNEMDQFWLPDQRSETRRPYLNSILNNVIVVQIACGSLHAIILTNQGLVYSSGQNDDGALGRPDESATDEDSDKISKLVDLPMKVNMISAGDSHSIAANSELGICFQWGTYRNTEKANLAPPARTPVRVGAKELYRKKFLQILSGQQHSLVLTDDGELFGWGDPDMGVVGRIPKTRHGYEQALKVAKITQHKVSNIYTGGRHSFLKRLVKKAVPASEGVAEQKAVYAYCSWGLNNFGQLGLDLPEEKHLDVVFEPTQMKFFDNLEVKEFCGGESHSLALLQDGTIYAFGRNDIGQLGLGKVKDVHPVYGEVKEVNPKPFKIDTFPETAGKMTNIWTGANFCYSKDETGQCYSWGFGSNFVLGNRKDEDEDEYKPFVIPRDFFKNEIPFDFALGTQHVSYYVNLAEDGQQHTVAKELLQDAPEEFLPPHMRVKTIATALAKAQAEKEERAAKKAEESAKRKEAEAAKKLADEQKKAEKEKERLAKKAEEEEKKKERSASKKAAEDKLETKKKPEAKKDGDKKRSASSTKKNGKNTSNSKSRSKSKTPAAKSKSQSKERSDSKKPVKAPVAKSKSVPSTNGSSNKKKPAADEEAIVSQSKTSKQLKKEPATKKK